MSAFLIERFPPDYDVPDDRDDLDPEPDDIDPTDPQRRQRPKIRRCRLTAHQLSTLNSVFDKDSQPSMESRVALGVQLGMETKQVSAWFQNKRQKLKNTHPPPFSPLPQPSSSYPRDFDSQRHDLPEYRNQPHYHTEVPHPDYSRYHQGHLDYQRGPHRLAPATFDLEHPHHRPIDRFQQPYYDRLDMKPTTSTFQLTQPVEIRPAPSPPSSNTEKPRSIYSRSASMGTEHSRATDFAPSENIKDLSTVPKAKGEPMDEDHYSLAIKLPSPPPPEAAQASPASRNKSVTVTPTNRRTSGRTRSARLAASPLASQNRPVSSTASAANQGAAQPKRLTRSRMSTSQREYLQKIYKDNPEPTMAERQMMADTIGVQLGKVTNWFRNLRQSVRRGKLLDAQLASARETTADSSRTDDSNEMDVDEDGSEYEHDDVHVSPSPAPVAPGIVPGKGAYSTHSLIVASEFALQSPPSGYDDDDDDYDEEESHEALTPYHSPEAKVSHSFGHSAATRHSPEATLSTPTRGSICLPSINITLASSDDEKKRGNQKYRSAYEDALLLLHFRQNCDVRDIQSGAIGRSSSPPLF